MGSYSGKTKDAEHPEEIKVIVEVLSPDAEIIFQSIRPDLTSSKRFTIYVGDRTIEIRAKDPTAARASLHSVMRILSLLDDTKRLLRINK